MLTVEPGARFIATLRPMEYGEWQASCRVIIDRLAYVDDEAIGPNIFSSELEARKWAHVQAASRGFDKLAIRRATDGATGDRRTAEVKED